MSRNVKVVSLSLEPEMHDKLKSLSKQKGLNNVSQLIRDVLDRFLILDDDIIPVIVKIPINLKGDKEGLKSWLEKKSDALVNHFCS